MPNDGALRRPLTAALWVVPVLLLAGCAHEGGNTTPSPNVPTAPSAAPDSPWPNINLPFAENARDMNDAPVVVVEGHHVLVGGEVVGDVAVIEQTHRMQRIDGLFTRLKGDREIWRNTHLTLPFHGEVNLAIDAGVSARVVKSVFQTAAFAGYPYPSFVVRRLKPGPDGSPYGRITADAQVPGPPRPAEAGEGIGIRGITPPSMRGGGVAPVNGRLPAEIIQRTIRTNFAAFRACYEKGLAHNPHLEGKVSIRFVIARDGHVATAEAVDLPSVFPLGPVTADPVKHDTTPRMPDPNVEACVVDGFSKLTFPAPEGGIVTVVYPIIFNPGK